MGRIFYPTTSTRCSNQSFLCGYKGFNGYKVAGPYVVGNPKATTKSKDYHEDPWIDLITTNQVAFVLSTTGIDRDLATSDQSRTT